MHSLSGNLRSITHLTHMSLVPRLPREMRLPTLLKLLQNPHVLLTFDTVHNALRLPRETTSERQKMVQACGAFNILTWICASRHNDLHFFDISISKSAPGMVCIVHFDLETCFAPQRCALFFI